MVRNTKTHSSTGITLLTHWHAYMLAIQLANKCVTFAQYIASLSLPLRGMAWQALRLKNVLLCQRVDISKRRCISYGPPECRYACAEYKYLVRVYGATNAWPLRTIYHDTQWKGWRSCPYIPYIQICMNARMFICVRICHMHTHYVRTCEQFLAHMP